MYLGPFLLTLGLLPTVSAATTSYMTLFTSSSATVQYIALGRVLPDYGAILFFLAGVASYIGQRFIVGPIRKRNMTSLLVLILGGIIGLAAVLLCITGGMQIVRDYKQGNSFGFKSLCQEPLSMLPSTRSSNSRLVFLLTRKCFHMCSPPAAHVNVGACVESFSNAACNVSLATPACTSVGACLHGGVTDGLVVRACTATNATLGSCASGANASVVPGQCTQALGKFVIVKCDVPL